MDGNLESKVQILITYNTKTCREVSSSNLTLMDRVVMLFLSWQNNWDTCRLVGYYYYFEENGC